SYAWTLDGSAAGTNGPSLTVPTGSLTIGAHTVAVVVTGQCGAVTNSASLTVNALTGAAGLSDATVCRGTNANFSVTASGTAPFDYAWTVNGNTAGTNGPSLTVPTASLALGTHTIAVVVTGQCGSATNSATLTVDDSPPVAVCQDITVQLDATGHVNITPAQIDNGSNDACGIASLSLSKTNFDCTNIGTNLVTLTVTDNSGNTQTCTATVTVQDQPAPVAVCQNITVQLDATGTVTITPAQVNNGSSDACGIASLSLDKTNFDCGNIGTNLVTLTMTDNHGNTQTCTATVTVVDAVAPTITIND